jgi:hypothetical protein
MTVFKEIWDGKNWVKKPLCQNAYRNTEINCGRGIGLHPQCLDNIQEYRVTIHYRNCIGDEFAQDTFYLCRECLSHLKKQCRGHKIEYEKLIGGGR